jgi:hypothetical protein
LSSDQFVEGVVAAGTVGTPGSAGGKPGIEVGKDGKGTVGIEGSTGTFVVDGS